MKLRAAKIFVTSLPQAADFYGERVGLTLKAGGADKGFCIFDTGPTQLIVEPVTQNAPATQRSLVGRYTGLSLITDDIAKTHEALVARGVAFSAAPEQQFWGGWVATMVDPDGNVMQIIQQ
jgi:predicted enzyme related to lactoylglutathione lyase